MFDRTTYEIKAHIGTIAERKSLGETWAKEVNLVSWNGKPAVIDVREWNSDHTKMKHGITLNDTEVDNLVYWLMDYQERRYL
jgi:hypothetical protein